MKRTFLALAALVVCAQLNAQDVNYTTISGGMTPTSTEVLKVKNGMISHLRTGSVGYYGTTDKWIGIGQDSLTPDYGVLVQHAGNGLFAGYKSTNPYIDWVDNIYYGASAKDLTFRHGVGASYYTSYKDIFKLRSNGSALLGTSPYFTTQPKFEIHNDSTFSLAQGIRSRDADGLLVHSTVETDEKLRFGIQSYVRARRTSKDTIWGIYTTAVNEDDDPNSTELAGGLYAHGENARVSYGVIAEGYTKGDQAYGIYAAAGWAGTNYAGFFDGDVYSTGTVTWSDRKFKKDIHPATGALAKLNLLKPVEYNFIQDKGYNFSKELQHGFIAQDVEKVFPELVKNAKRPIMEKGKPVGYEDFKGVNYTGLISVLTKALQELNERVQSLEAQLKTTETYIVKEASLTGSEKLLVDAKAFGLSQNAPNPFTSTTTIGYNIPSGSEAAMIAVFDLNGKMLLQFNELQGRSKLTISGSTLQPGMYLYSLIVNGKEVTSKKMILTR